jgi:hypothetical protein
MPRRGDNLAATDAGASRVRQWRVATAQRATFSGTRGNVAGGGLSDREAVRGCRTAGLKGTFAQLAFRGDGPLMEQWITSPTGRRWRITLPAAD